MYYRSHQWINIPETRTEIRREFNVRESCHTAMAWDNKYQNIDTGKFDREKIPSIKSESWAELISDVDGHYYDNHRVAGFDYFNGLEEQYNAIKFPDREKKLLKQRKLEEKLENKHQQEDFQDKKERQDLLREIEDYRKIGETRELELKMQKEQSEPICKSFVCNIRPNKWSGPR